MLFKGAIFDLDGVITQTAKVHFKAWKNTFEPFLKQVEKEKGIEYRDFTHDDDYVPFVDGKPRYEGVQSFLESRGISLPLGDISDQPGSDTICAIGNSKNDAFRAVIEKDGAEIYESTVALIKQLLEKDIHIGCASSSKNCRFILETTGLIDLFEVVIDGNSSKEMGLKGKPEPDIFITAAEKMGLMANDCIMVEDAISGVQAGRNGNFPLVLGLARHGDFEALLANGADIVVSDISEISLDDINDWLTEGIENDGWTLTYYGFDPENERLRETLTTVGNGYFASRGSFEGIKATRDTHYPATYVAGLYNKLPTKVHEKDVYNNDFVNCPNWMLIELKIGDEDYINPFSHEIIQYEHTLDIQDGVVCKEITFKDNKGRITTLEIERFVSMDAAHIAAIEYRLIPQNYSEQITIKSGIDGDIINDGVARYRSLSSKHIKTIFCDFIDEECRMHSKTTTSNIDIWINAKNNIDIDTVDIKTIKDTNYIGQTFTFNAEANSIYTLEKIASIHTSKDQDVDDPSTASQSAIKACDNYSELYEKNSIAWANLWDKADIVITGDRFAQKTIRLHIYHLIVTASPHNKSIDTGMPPRGLHGEAYRGHIFWDELYIFPFFNLHFPDITKALLMYRYNRLDGARQYAKEHGYLGAMYPWQTADGGDEETQVIHYNPVSGKWDPDLSCRQRHVSLAVAYNVWDYFRHTDDTDFLYRYGLEMLLEITRFWASISTYDAHDQKYHIEGVMGPDEFHEKYEGSKTGGIKDNAYTNVMVSWLMDTVIQLLNDTPPAIASGLLQNLKITSTEIESWKDIKQNMAVILNDNGVISQFDGYFDLKELDWDAYRKKYGNIHRMDRILKAENDSPDHYKVAKQADTLMLFYVLGPQKVKEILTGLGYDINDDALDLLKKNYDYYVNRTSHGSTLSHVVHSAILQYLPEERQDLWAWFIHALKSDIRDTQGGTTPEGIHCGVMAGTIQIILNSFAGLTCTDKDVTISPTLPKHWQSLAFKVKHLGQWYQIDIDQNQSNVDLIKGA